MADSWLWNKWIDLSLPYSLLSLSGGRPSRNAATTTSPLHPAGSIFLCSFNPETSRHREIDLLAETALKWNDPCAGLWIHTEQASVSSATCLHQLDNPHSVLKTCRGCSALCPIKSVMFNWWRQRPGFYLSFIPPSLRNSVLNQVCKLLLYLGSRWNPLF